MLFHVFCVKLVSAFILKGCSAFTVKSHMGCKGAQVHWTCVLGNQEASKEAASTARIREKLSLVCFKFMIFVSSCEVISNEDCL